MCLLCYYYYYYQLPDDPSDDSRAQLWGDENEPPVEKPPVSSESEPMEEEVPETPVPTPPAPESVPTVSLRSVRSVRSRRSPPVVVTSRTVIREPQAVPYDAYVGLSRECDFLRGQNYELRRLVDSLAVGPRGVSTAALIPDFSARIRALAHIAAQRLDTMVPDSDGRGAGSSAGGGAEMARLVAWLVEEMRALGRPE